MTSGGTVDSLPLHAMELRTEQDVVLARQRVREVAARLGLDALEQARVVAAVSEIARNAWRYAGGGRVAIAVSPAGPAGEPAMLMVRVTDRGKGIAGVDSAGGPPPGSSGMQRARRLLDVFHVESAPGRGTDVLLGRRLPARAPSVTPERAAAVAAELARSAPRSTVDELEAQQVELLRTLDELRTRQEEIERLNGELAETNRGVLALYAELEDRAYELHRASQLKTSFLSNASHELRTPLSSIVNLSRLLLDHTGTQFGEEQRRQAQFIRKSAQALFDIVNDLLDIAKIEAGKVDVRIAPVIVADLLGTLRGVVRPLLASDAVAFVLDPVDEELVMLTDEGKLAQVLRNFLSNAVKYTEHGEVRLSARVLDDDAVAFSVHDSGIGIAPSQVERIFEEFVQIEGPLQSRVKGTGLGLPLSRRLASLLGGHIDVESVPGVGSTFTLVVPRVLQEPAHADVPPPPPPTPRGIPVGATRA